MPPIPITTTSWLQKTPGVCGGDACIRNTRHTVAGLVQWQRLGLSNVQILEHHPDWTGAGMLEIAWWYYHRNRAEIDQTIKEDVEA